MPRELTPGKLAAIRAFRSRRNERGLKQKDIIELVSADLSRRSVENFEAGQSWPRDSSLQALSKAVGWDKDRLKDLADDYDAGRVGTNVDLSHVSTQDLLAEISRRVATMEGSDDDSVADESRGADVIPIHDDRPEWERNAARIEPVDGGDDGDL